MSEATITSLAKKKKFLAQKNLKKKFSSLRSDGNRELVTVIVLTLMIRNTANTTCLFMHTVQNNAKYRLNSKPAMHKNNYG